MQPLWTSRRAVVLHVTAAVVVPGCLALGWWQLGRAIGGNELSWAYTFEWPLFAGYGLYMWWRLVHDQPGARADGDPAGPEDGAPAEPGADAEPGGRTAPGAGAPGDAGQGAVPAAAGGPPSADGEDEELAAYNRYLAALNASGRRKHW